MTRRARLTAIRPHFGLLLRASRLELRLPTEADAVALLTAVLD